MHPLIIEIVAWKEAPRQDVLRRIQQQVVAQLQPRLDEADQMEVRIAALEQELAAKSSKTRVA